MTVTTAWWLVRRAAQPMMDHGISWLPVVRSKDDLRSVGSVRGDKISYRITKKIAQTEVNYAQIANSIPMVR